jgi:hypothetical protein
VTGRPGAKRIGSVLVDTNGDLTPDTVLFGSSNFAPGWSPNTPRTKVIQEKSCTLCESESCHSDDGDQHCTGPVYACNGTYCPKLPASQLKVSARPSQARSRERAF